MSAVKLSFAGETVTLTSWHSLSRGKYKSFKAYFQGDNPDGGHPIHSSVEFSHEVAALFREIGLDVTWQFSHKTFQFNVDVVLGTQSTKRGEKLCIDHVIAPDGTVHAVELADRTTVSKRKTFSVDELADHKRKRDLQLNRFKRTVDSRFQAGELLHTYQRTENRYYLQEVAGEYVLLYRKDLAA